MTKPTVFLTGATGVMGSQALSRMVNNLDSYKLLILVRDSEKNRKKLAQYQNTPGLEIVWGNLSDYETVYRCVEKSDLVLHVAVYIYPQPNFDPKKAMQVNYGSTRNLIRAILEQGRQDSCKFVYIGTVAETGDRMPPIHWGRVGDPIKPSMFDYYAVSKVASERLVVESGLKYWAVLRQTGIMGPTMAKVTDPVMFHNCFDNVLEYVSDRDSGILLEHLARYDAKGKLPGDFWEHIYNIGGGESCRVSTAELYDKLYGVLGFKDLSNILKPRMQATRNFHGQYYLDSDKLEDYLHFCNDSMQYFYDAYLENLGAVVPFSKAVCKLPGGQKLMGKIIGSTFAKLAKEEDGTEHFIADNVEDHIDAFWGSRKNWKEIPKKYRDQTRFAYRNNVVAIDHGYDESKPESELNLEDVRGAAKFRGGELLSKQMETGDWRTKLRFRCAFGHEFEASPRLVLEGGHWCDVCERTSWNYGKRAKVDPFFAQVWNPLHDEFEIREYPKIVSELDV